VLIVSEKFDAGRELPCGCHRNSSTIAG